MGGCALGKAQRRHKLTRAWPARRTRDPAASVDESNRGASTDIAKSLIRWLVLNSGANTDLLLAQRGGSYPSQRLSQSLKPP